jgi:two-component sensor histidine kinase
MRLLGFLNLRGISGQIAALVVASIIAIHLILTATFLIYRPDQPPFDRGQGQLVAVVQLLGAAPAVERPRLFADVARAFPQLDIGSLPPGPAPAADEPDGLNPRSLHRRLGNNYRFLSLPPQENTPQGRYRAGPHSGSGAARAPLRLKLSAALANDDSGAVKARAVHRLESVLSFLRNDRKFESMTLVDIATTLQLVTDQFADMGHKVAYDGPEHAMGTLRPDDLHRSITNLVENAVKFGAEATIRLKLARDIVTIEVEDDGPGISDARKDAMLEPFVRGDDARNMDEAAGFGLGLSIARAIVLAHGGELSLNDRQPHGLIVRIELPVHQEIQQAAA